MFANNLKELNHLENAQGRLHLKVLPKIFTVSAIAEKINLKLNVWSTNDAVTPKFYVRLWETMHSRDNLWENFDFLRKLKENSLMKNYFFMIFSRNDSPFNFYISGKWWRSDRHFLIIHKISLPSGNWENCPIPSCRH